MKENDGENMKFSYQSLLMPARDARFQKIFEDFGRHLFVTGHFDFVTECMEVKILLQRSNLPIEDVTYILVHPISVFHVL